MSSPSVDSATNGRRGAGVSALLDSAFGFLVWAAHFLMVYISTAAVGSYVVGSTGAAGSLSSVAVNAQITAYGSYANSRSFTAKSIVIE